MNSRVFYLCILIAAALGSIRSGSAAPLPNSLSPPHKPERGLEPELAYTNWRWIGLRSKGIDHCPAVEGWSAEPLLDLALRKAEGKDQPCDCYAKPREVQLGFAEHLKLHKLGLDRYCIYTALTPPPHNFLPPAGLKEAKKDRMALSFASAGGRPVAELDGMIWKDLAKQAKVHTQQIKPESSVHLKGKPGVRLVFIDSEPDGEGFPPKPSQGESPHGFTLAYLARDLICPSGENCAATVATRLALGHRGVTPQEPMPLQENPKAGHMGLVSDVASAIIAEVSYWRKFERDKKLILNLSLGWDGEGFGDLGKHRVSQLEPSVQAVYKALRYARHYGVLVIAAAGNQRGSQTTAGNQQVSKKIETTQWPLLPAAWELRRPTLFHFSFFRKLVYAVGGVDGYGMPIPNSRVGGRPRRVAYADHSVTEAAPDDPTAMYTGTSVSTAVTSSIAAVVWHLRPELTPSQVMRLVFRSGNRQDTRADFYAWKKIPLISDVLPAPYTRQLSLCPAVLGACGDDGARCAGTLASLPKCELKKGSASLGEVLSEKNLPAKMWHTASPAPAPEESFDAASKRWVFPQPDVTPCPGCTLVRHPPDALQPEIVLEISEEWLGQAATENVTLEKATLVITSSDGPPLTSVLRITSGELMMPRTVHKVPVTGVGALSSKFSAHIVFEMKVFKGPSTVLNPVYVAD
ncbi:MAG TPA: S8/S53 family peptidase [Thermoanaerobaculia bacterium]|nr:S8/S53 family peptidase [Thermoanaerobaculia bacterium]